MFAGKTFGAKGPEKLAFPHAYSSGTGVAGPRQAFSYSSSVIGRNPAQSAYAAQSFQDIKFWAWSGRQL